MRSHLLVSASSSANHFFDLFSPVHDNGYLRSDVRCPRNCSVSPNSPLLRYYFKVVPSITYGTVLSPITLITNALYNSCPKES